MKTKNIFAAILGLAFLVLALAPIVSAGQTWFYFESNTGASSMTVNPGTQINLVMTASSNNNVAVSQEKLEAIQGPNTYTLTSWNQPGIQYGSTYLFNMPSYTLDTNVLGSGTYTLRFSAQTNTGLTYSDLTLTINAVDTTAPVITLLGSDPVTVALGSVYNDAGATASDNLDGDITTSIVVANSVNTAVAGTYTITYNVQDSSGNSATQVTRSVTVSPNSDINAPTITISGPVNGQTYTTAVTNITYVANDAEGNLAQCWYSLNGGVTNSTAVSCSNGISNSFSGLVPQQGSNTWTIYAQDTAGNLGSASVTFNVNDLTAPTITAIAPLNNATLDDTDVTLKVSTNEDATLKYSINGATNVTMIKTSNFEFWSNLLNLDDEEEYTVIYTATDVMGNTASLTVKFKIDEDLNNEEDNDEETSFSTEDLGGITLEPAIDLTDDEPKTLNWFQRFINWICRVFGLEEVY